MRLLLVEDDAALRDSIGKQLKQTGFALDLADNGVDAEFLGDETAYAVVILDLGLPQRNGLEVLRNWRKKGNRVPVIVLTARDTWHERVDGLKAGADDYLGKPFHFEELLARLQALIRRNWNADLGQNHLHYHGLQLDEERQQVTSPEGTVIDLTGIEFRLLRYFMLHPGKLCSQAQLAQHVYDHPYDHESNVIEVYISHLRRKIGKDWIQTRRGQGYIFCHTL